MWKKEMEALKPEEIVAAYEHNCKVGPGTFGRISKDKAREVALKEMPVVWPSEHWFRNLIGWNTGRSKGEVERERISYQLYKTEIGVLNKFKGHPNVVMFRGSTG